MAGSLGEPSHQFAMSAKNLPHVPVEAHDISPRTRSFVEVQDVRRERQFQATRLGFELPAKFRRCLKLNGF